MTLLSRGILAPVLLLVWTVSVLPSSAQVSGTTATLRGSVNDASGGVLPGATVTLVNSATRALLTGATDQRGAFTFTSLFPGSYDLRVELSGFKASEQQGISLSPNDTRGIAVRLQIGSQSEVVIVRATDLEVMQTETGARESVLTAHQIDNLSVISRSPLELLRILPGVVAPDQRQLEIVSFLVGANYTVAYTVNGIRSSGNTVSLDGSSLVSIGCNCALNSTVNNDMVQEVKVQSSNFGAEFGSGAINVSAVTKSGSSKFSGSLYDYIRDWRFAANDRSNSIAGIEQPKSGFFYPGGNIGGPIPLPLSGYNTNRDKLFFWFGLEGQRQKVDSGSRLSTTFSERARTGDLSEFLANRGQNLDHPAIVLIPGAFSGEGTPAPANNLAPYVTPLGRAMASLYPLPNYTDPNNRYNYVYSALEATNRLEIKMRFDWSISSNTKAYVRIARDSEEGEGPRGPWGGASDLALPTPAVGNSRGRSYVGNIVHVLNPTMTNEIVATFTRATGNHSYEDPSKLRLDALNVEFQGVFPSQQSPYVPFNAHWVGSQLGNFGPYFSDLHGHEDKLQFADKLVKVWGAHLLKVGVSIDRLQRQQQNFNEENGVLIYGPGTPGSTGSQLGDLLAGRPAQIIQGTRVHEARFRMWNVEGFAQDSWKIRPNVTLEYGARLGYWTNNAEQNGLENWFDPSMYDPTRGTFIDSQQSTQLNGVRYVARGEAPLGVFPNRRPFALPRVNVAWDIGGNGVSVLRGGYGVFANRPAGYVENGSLYIPPNAYHVLADAFYDTQLGGTGLTYDTVHLIPLTALLGTQVIYTPTPRSFTFPKTDSYSVSFSQRFFWNQVIEVAYVGTRGRDLVSNVNSNVVPPDTLSSGVLGNADLSIPREPCQPRFQRGELPAAVRGLWTDFNQRLRRPLAVPLAPGDSEPANEQTVAVLWSCTRSAKHRGRWEARIWSAIRSTPRGLTAC